jgi:hypothetical protein
MRGGKDEKLTSGARMGRPRKAVACEERAGLCERAGPDPRERFQMEMIFEFQWNLKFGKTFRNSTWRFRRNLSIRIFPNFF